MNIHNTYTKMAIRINSSTIYTHSDNKNDDLLNTRENVYYMIRHTASFYLQSKNEFNNSQNNNNYYIIKVHNSKQIELFLLYASFYYLDSIKNNNSLIVGIDFEFNNKKIALCQISYYPARKYKYIFVINPSMFTFHQKEILIKTVFTSPIYRVLHGSESLDIPYLYNELFNHNFEIIKKFTETLIDTRFLCEAHKIRIHEQNKKCSIYDALLYFNVITKQKYDDLQKNNDAMGPIYKVNWNINTMSNHSLKYAIYDVLFLKEFVIALFTISNNKLCKYTTDANRFVYYEKHGISTIIRDSVGYINKNNKYTSIYISIINKIPIASNLLDINYFKSTLIAIFKIIIYSCIDNYINKNKNKHKDELNKSIYNALDGLKLNKFIRLLKFIARESKLFLLNNYITINEHNTKNT